MNKNSRIGIVIALVVVVGVVLAIKQTIVSPLRAAKAHVVRSYSILPPFNPNNTIQPHLLPRRQRQPPHRPKRNASPAG